MNQLIAVLAAVAASFVLGAADVIEQRSTHTVARRRPLDPRLLWDLVRKRSWRIGIGVNAAGSGLQILALHFGPLALVQPILVTTLLWASLISVMVTPGRHFDRVMVTGVLCCTGGLALFLAVARPHGDRASVSPMIMLPLGIGLAAGVAVCLAAAHFGPRDARPLAIALACGIVFGVNAFLLKQVTRTLGQGFSPPSRQWPLYAEIVVGPTGFLLNQNAFQAGTLIAPVLSIITVTDPLVSITIGVLWLNEHLASSPAAIAAEAAGLAIMTLGVVALAHRSPHVASQAAAAPREA